MSWSDRGVFTMLSCTVFFESRKRYILYSNAIPMENRFALFLEWLPALASRLSHAPAHHSGSRSA